MGFDSLFTGITGLNSYQNWIDMLSNNIANTATTGFKGQRMTFADMFYQETGFASGPTKARGGINPQDMGLGVRVNTVDTQFAQGGLETTGINTDVALNGDGFFILRNVDGSSAPTYTRDGAFSLNANGMLYDPATGLAVQGYTANNSGVITASGTPGNITIPIGLQEQATATGAGAKVGPSANDKVFDIAFGGNLDQTQWAQQYQNVSGASATAGQSKTVTTTIYDSLGNAHQAPITYAPDATGATAASNNLPATVADAQGNARIPATRWKVSVSFTDGTQFAAITTPGTAAGGAPVTTNAASGVVGYVYFDQNGQFINSSSIENSGGTAIGAAGAANVHTAGSTPSVNQGNQLNITTWGPGAGNNALAPTAGGAAPTPGPIALDFSNNASLAGSSTANVISQNGYSAGTLSNITIGQDGTIVGAFTNGQQKALAQIAVATFQNEGGLQRLGGNAFGQTAASGLAQVGTAGTGRYGTMVAGSLEQSNVNLADQFTKLIVAQRAFEANSRGITTADQNLITLINLRASEN